MPNHHLFTIPGSNTSFYMLPVEGGTFRMGSDPNDPDAFDDEKTDQPYIVTVPAFCMAQYLVTQALWREVLALPATQDYIKEQNINLNPEPSDFSGPNRPVERVSWHDTQQFMAILNHLFPKAKFRLPSEAEWEYAARGGINAENEYQNYKYAGGDQLTAQGWFDGNAQSETKKVGLKQPNVLGLHYLSGNVWEWCADQWHDKYDLSRKTAEAWVDSDEKGADRVLRGGGYFFTSLNCRVAGRGSNHPDFRWTDYGFRLVCSPSEVVCPSGLPVSKKETSQNT